MFAVNKGIRAVDKSALQSRAERASSLFVDRARRPVVVEFAGVPKAGKTTILSQAYAFFRRCGFRVEVVIERASVCPIRDKKHSNFNVWTAATTLAQVLEKTQNPPNVDDPHILFLDRGIFDAICWLGLMERLQRIRPSEKAIIERFLTIDDWKRRISGVILMTASPSDSMKREQGLLPVVGGEGSIMNEKVLTKMVEIVRDTASRLTRDFRVVEINTSAGPTKDNPKRTAEVVAETILSFVEEHIEEEILSLPKERTLGLMQGNECVGPDVAATLVGEFEDRGEFCGRTGVENDRGRIQALPVVVVRNASGEVLRLRRKEKDDNNPLHEKIVIWAGGHVRKEDSQNGRPIEQCVIRELEEELRLRVELPDLTLLGAIYSDIGGSTSKHLAIVYEWRAKTDDVAVALSNSEFFERLGTSLSGKFVPTSKLQEELDKKKIDEVWSYYMVRDLLGLEGQSPELRLL